MNERELGFNPIEHIMALYEHCIPRTFTEPVRAGFIGPGDHSEIFAMDSLCIAKGMPFFFAQVDRPGSLYTVDKFKPYLLTDFIENPESVTQFFQTNHISTVIFRNPLVESGTFSPVIEKAIFRIAHWAATSRIRMLLTFRKDDHTPPIQPILTELGAKKQILHGKQGKLFQLCTEEHAYVIHP